MPSQKDFSDIKKIYLSSGLSLYALAKQCGVNYRTLRDHAMKEKWSDEREKVRKKAEQKLQEKIEEQKVQMAAKYIGAGASLMDKVIEGIGLLNPEDFDAQRKVAATLKDLREILNVRSPAEQREQEARIKNLERQLEEANGNGSGELVVRLEGEADEYAG